MRGKFDACRPTTRGATIAALMRSPGSLASRRASVVVLLTAACVAPSPPATHAPTPAPPPPTTLAAPAPARFGEAATPGPAR